MKSSSEGIRLKIIAQRAVKEAKRKGLLIPGPCAQCGALNNGTRANCAHHPDYSKPLDVIWLCYDCHNNLHSSSEDLPLSPVARWHEYFRLLFPSRASEAKAKCGTLVLVSGEVKPGVTIRSIYGHQN